MGREFYWEDRGTGGCPGLSVLYGPEPHMIAAVITLDRGIPEMQDGCWRVMSNEYRSLNLEEPDTSLSLKQIKNRTLIRLDQELKDRQEQIEEDRSGIHGLLFADLPDDPYE